MQVVFWFIEENMLKSNHCALIPGDLDSREGAVVSAGLLDLIEFPLEEG